MKTSGQIAFEAYNAERGGVTHDGKPTPPWEALGDGVRSGWEAAARAVLPDPAAVRAAQVMAADFLEEKLPEARYFVSAHGERVERNLINGYAHQLYDIARTVREPRDDGGNVDHLTLLEIGSDVDAFTSLDEVSDKVADLRRVASASTPAGPECERCGAAPGHLALTCAVCAFQLEGTAYWQAHHAGAEALRSKAAEHLEAQAAAIEGEDALAAHALRAAATTVRGMVVGDG